MKRCQKCSRTYTDDTLNFCLEDGDWLHEVSEPDEPATAFLSSELPTSIHHGESSLRSDAAPTSQNIVLSKNLILAGILSVLVIVFLASGGYWLYSSATSKQIDSIAVMPFVNESGNPEFEYVSDGVTEELISSLTRLPGLTVKPRSTIIRYKGQTTEARTLGKELQVAAILNGSVAQRGDELSLHVELVDATTDSVLWSDDYRKPLSALATLHSEIARDIAEQLRAKLSSADQQNLAKKYTNNPEAYQLYRKGRFHWSKGSKDDVYRAIDHYQQAIKLDPNYAVAYAGLADAYMNLPGYDRTVTPLETSPKARDYTLRALTLDDSLSEAHVAMARVLMYYDHDFAGSEREFRKGIDLDPNNAFAFHSYGGLLTGLGRFEEAEANHIRAIELEPESQALLRGYASSLLAARRYDEAEAQLKKAAELDPNRPVTYYALCSLYILRGREQEAVEACARSREIISIPQAAADMRETFAKGGFKEFMRGLADDRWPAAGNIAYIYATYFMVLGEKERVLEKLEKSYEDREGFIPMLNVDPRFDGLRDEPRFQALIKKIGFTDR